MNGFQILGRHYILVFDVEFFACFAVAHGVGTAADLIASTAVGTRIHLMQTHIALSAHRHAQCAMTEHFESDPLSGRAAYIFLTDHLRNLPYLIHIQFAGQHHDVGKLRIESHSGGIADIHLSGDMHLLPYLAGIQDGSHIGGDDSGDSGFLGTADDCPHRLHIGIIYHGVDREISLHPSFGAEGSDLSHIVGCEISTRTGAHIQTFDTEIYGIRTRLYSRGERFATPHGSHYLKILTGHFLAK